MATPRSRWSLVSRALVAAGAGAFVSLTLSPTSLVVGLLGYGALLLVLMPAGPWERAALGGVFGFAFHLAGLWWVGAAFLVDAETFGALLPLGVIGLPLLLAPFHAVAAVLAGLVPPRGVPRWLALAAALTLTEALRGVLFTGFPWNVPAVQLAASPVMAQGAALLGVEGLSLVAVLVGAAPALAFTRGPGRIAAAAGAAGLVVAIGLYGSERLASVEPAEGPLLRVVQPNIAQADKWDPSERPRIWNTLLALTGGEGAPALVVWPETALPFLYRTPSVEQAMLAETLPERAFLLTGAVEMEGEGEARRATNSVFVMGPDAVVRERYDKVKLVPFGEFLPLRGILERLGLRALVENASAFAAGEGARALPTPAGLAQPLVCYEVIFPHFAPGGVRPAFLVNVTNDAWFGDTPGPHQHLAHARLRAVASGIPVVRAANTGISAVIDGKGRLRASLPLNVAGSFDARLPPVASAVPQWARLLAAALLWALTAAGAWVYSVMGENRAIGEMFRNSGIAISIITYYLCQSNQ